MERGRCENISTLHLSPPAFASASLTENTELSVLRLALDSRKRIQPAKGGSVKMLTNSEPLLSRKKPYFNWMKKLVFKKKDELDIIAHHEIQYQAVKPFVELLAKKIHCNILIGPDREPTGAKSCLIVDHCAFQPRVSKKNYNLIIHAIHDLGDFEVYREEYESLKNFDIFLTPGRLFWEKAHKSFPNKKKILSGWPKNKSDHTSKRSEISLLYAPTWLDNNEWRKILPILKKTNYRTFVKNHIYYNFEIKEKPPKGQEKKYKKCIKELKKMEILCKKIKNITLVDRKSNLCELFGLCNVLITDTSSAAAEFTRNGLCIETGRIGPREKDSLPYLSGIDSTIQYIPSYKLKEYLNKKNLLRQLQIRQTNTKNNIWFIKTKQKSLKEIVNQIIKEIKIK